MIKKIVLLLVVLNSLFLIALPQDIDKAFEYFNSGKYYQAASEFENSLPFLEKEFGITDTSYYTKIIIITGICFSKSQQYNKAEFYYLKAKKVYEMIMATNCQWYSTVLNNLGLIYSKKGDFKKTEQFYLQALQIDKNFGGGENFNYGTDLLNLAEFYRKKGNYEKAESYNLEALEIYKKTVGENDPSFATVLNNLGVMYADMGIYDKAMSYSLFAMKIRLKAFGEENPDYAASLNNIALLFQEMGNYEKAETLYLKAMQIDKNVLGDEHLDYATDLNNIAILYICLGNYEKAKSLLQQSLRIRKNVLGEEHPDYANSLNNLAELYSSMRLYTDAELLYLQALIIIKKVFGEEHSLYAKTIYNLAKIYLCTGKYEKAEDFLVQSIKINKIVFGIDNMDFANSLNSLGELYLLSRNYKKAEYNVLQAYEIGKNVLGDENGINYTFLNNLIFIYEIMGDNEKVDSLICKSILLFDSNLESGLSFLSEKEMQLYIETAKYNFEFYKSYFIQRGKDNQSITTKAYNLELETKVILLHSNILMKQNIHNCGDTLIINIYNRFITLRALLNNQLSIPIKERTLDTKKLEEDINTIEKKLINLSKFYANSEHFLKIKHKDVQQNLMDNDVSIEFSSFNYYNGKRWTDSIYYVALVLRKNDKYPQMIYLCEQKQLDSVFNQSSGDEKQKAYQLYANRGIIINGSSKQMASKLYSLIWKPIESLLKDVKTIYFSPSGLLNKVSFAAIATPDSMFLSDKYKLVQLGSTAEILRIKEQEDYISDKDTALVFGGINYERMKTNAVKEDSNEIVAYNRGPQISKDSTRGTSWNYLAGTYKEASYIDSLFRKNKVSTAFYSDSNATETLFKNISGKAPQIIHVSTHGFFFPEIKEMRNKDAFVSIGEQTYRFSDNPLLRSGLIMAGANYVWKGGEQTPGQDDGILTAYEVSNMNLYNTKLVVLSACETGLGDIKGSEGVYGLQRAFKMAGADYIIMSLWQVPDKETVEFMQVFYNNCLNHQTIRDSFANAQLVMRKKYAPYYWAAFVMIE